MTYKSIWNTDWSLNYEELLRSFKLVNQHTNPNPEEGIDPLKKYGINLTELAQKGKIDPVIGREDEIRRVIRFYLEEKK